MSILLPSEPSFAEALPRFMDFGGVQRGQLGGADQRLNRLGNRWALDLALPTLTGAQQREWSALLVAAVSQGALFKVPQPDLAIGNPGVPVVNGAGQAGSSINLRGFAPGYPVRRGQFFSIVQGGRRYLQQAANAAAANGAGVLAGLAVNPMLRISPADGAVCEFAVPYIEGFLAGQLALGTITPAKLAKGVGLSIEEAR